MMINVADYPEVGAAAEVESIDLGAEAPRQDVPQTWSARYSEQDQADVATVIKWLNATGKPQSWLARVSRVNPGTFNQVVKGAYIASPSKFLAAMLDAIRVQDERTGNRKIPFVETSVWKLAASVYHRARTRRNIGVFISNVGTGKTESAREYRRRYSNIYMIECLPGMSASALLDEMCKQLNLNAEARGASKEKKFVLVVRALKGTDGLVILDEAETVHPDSLRYVRRLRDLADVGIVMQGTSDLLALIKVDGGKFDQIRSRVGFWPDAIQTIERDDADEIALAAFEDLETPPDSEVLDAIWSICGGSARVLVESLVPAIRDYGLRKGRPLSVPLVRQVAKDILNIVAGSAGRNRREAA